MERQIILCLSALTLSTIASPALSLTQRFDQSHLASQATESLSKIDEVTATQTRTVKDEAQIRELTKKWFAVWSVKDKPFTGQGFEEVFATGKNEILVFDNFKGGVVTLTSLKDYITTWVPVMQSSFSYWEIKPEGAVNVTIDGDLAVSTFTWVSNGRFKDGKAARIRQHATHMWRRMNGQWRLVHEHLTIGNPPKS